MTDPTLTARIRAEIEDLHVFFVDWFTGKAPKTQLESRFLSSMDADMVFVSPEGDRLSRTDLTVGFEGAHGGNPDFRIAIRDVEVHREIGDLVLATYTEWQRGSKRSGREQSGRLTTVLMTRNAPHRWLHVHETWLPEAEQAAGPYDF